MSGCETCGYGATSAFTCGCEYTCFCDEDTDPCTCGVGKAPYDDYDSDYVSTYYSEYDSDTCSCGCDHPNTEYGCTSVEETTEDE